MPYASYFNIKEITNNFIYSLSELHIMKSWTPSEKLVEFIEKWPAERGTFRVLIIEFAEKCSKDPDSTRPMVKTVKKQLNTMEVLLENVTKKEELISFPEPASRYVNQLRSTPSDVKPLLPKKNPQPVTKYYTKLKIKNASRFSVNLSEESAEASRESRAAEAIRAAEAAAASSAEATTPAGSTLEGDSLPSFSFRLPKAYGHMLNSQEKDRYYRVQEFIALERARGVNDDYDLFSFKQCMALATFEGLHVIGEKHTRENPGRHLAEIFGGNVKDAKNYVLLYKNPYAKVSDKYLLKGEYPKLEAAYLAWLETR